MQWSELREALELVDDALVHEHRVAEPAAAVHDPMGDGAKLVRRVGEGRNRHRRLPVDHGQLQARRARVDD
jgi:hypothetical protein